MNSSEDYYGKNISCDVPFGDFVVVACQLSPDRPNSTIVPSVAPGLSLPATIVFSGSEVQIALVAIGDNGASGPMIGCGDIIVMVNKPFADGSDPLCVALEEQLAIRKRE